MGNCLWIGSGAFEEGANSSCLLECTPLPHPDATIQQLRERLVHPDPDKSTIQINAISISFSGSSGIDINLAPCSSFRLLLRLNPLTLI